MLGLKQRDEPVGHEARALVVQLACSLQHQRLELPPFSKWMFSMKTHDPSLAVCQVSFPKKLVTQVETLWKAPSHLSVCVWRPADSEGFLASPWQAEN